MENDAASPSTNRSLPPATSELAGAIRRQIFGVGRDLQDKFHARREAAYERERYRINLGRPEHMWVRPPWCPLHFGARLNKGSVELHWYTKHYRPKRPGERGLGDPITNAVGPGKRGDYSHRRLLSLARPFEADIVLQTEAAAAELRAILRDVRALGDVARRIRKAWARIDLGTPAASALDQPHSEDAAATMSCEDVPARPPGSHSYFEVDDDTWRRKSPRELFS